MDALDVTAWSDFGVGVAGAMAALTGLLFVAVSINLERIVAAPTLPRLALATLALFSTVLLAVICLLVPTQSTTTLGIELVVIGIGAGVPLVRLQLKKPRTTAYTNTLDWLATRLAPIVLVPGLIAATGVGLLAGWSGSLYLLAGATVVAVVGGLIGAWVLLIEILR